MPAALLQDPHWLAAARALISGCIDLRDSDARVDLLDAISRALGDELYPAFLRVLAEVGRHGEHDARAAVALALVHALRTGRLPSGRRGAWGGSASLGSNRLGRSLGPLEYLCAWAGQAESFTHLMQREFEASAEAVMTLVEASPEARALYCEKLAADAEDPIEGALSRSTRRAMLALARSWEGGAPAAEAVARFVDELTRDASPRWPTGLGSSGWPGRA